MTDAPHFALPFRFAPQAVVNDQDEIDEIADCILSILLCPAGFRVELPEFGIEEQTFRPSVDVEALRTAIDYWEPRAETLIEARPDALDELIARASVLVALRTEA